MLLADTFVDDGVKYDRSFTENPQIAITLLKDSLFTGKLNYVHGMGSKKEIGKSRAMVLSTALLSGYGKYEEDAFKALFIHEFGHACNVCLPDSENQQGLSDGIHCVRDDCIMNPHQIPEGMLKQSNVMYLVNILRKTRAQKRPAMCDTCQATIRFEFAKHSGDSRKIAAEANNYNLVHAREKSRPNAYFICNHQIGEY